MMPVKSTRFNQNTRWCQEEMDTRKDKMVQRKFENMRKLEELTWLNRQRHLWTRLYLCSEYLLQMQYGEKNFEMCV